MILRWALKLRPEDEWPTHGEMWVRDKKNWCTDEEWIKIVCGCADIGLFDFLGLYQLLTVGGIPVLHNALGIGKGKYLSDGREILRMVMNLDVTNQILRVVLEDIRGLPYPGQWNAISIEDENVIIVHSGTDLMCAYFAFQMEHLVEVHGPHRCDLWKQLENVCPDTKDESELFLTCLAMGFSLASGPTLLAHNQMAVCPKPMGCNLPIAADEDRPSTHEAGAGSVCHVVGDLQVNFEDSELGILRDVPKLMETECPHVVDMIATCAVWGATHAEKKTFHRRLVCESLGFIKDGILGAHYGTNSAVMILIVLTTSMCTMIYVQVRYLQIVAGRWFCCTQVRHELGQLLDRTWRALGAMGAARRT